LLAGNWIGSDGGAGHGWLIGRTPARAKAQGSYYLRGGNEASWACSQEGKPDLVFFSSKCQAPPSSFAPAPCAVGRFRSCGVDWIEAARQGVFSLPAPRERASISHRAAVAQAVRESPRATVHIAKESRTNTIVFAPMGEFIASRVLQFPLRRMHSCPSSATSCRPPFLPGADGPAFLRSW
jgi:hypothetical protein